MVGYYRLKELGFRLSAGAHVLPKEAFAPIEAGTALIEEARLAAEAIVGEAREVFEAERVRGYEEGLARARIDAAERLLRESDALDRRLAATEGRMSEVVVTCVRRIIHDFDDRTKAEALVRVALKQMRREKKAELRVSPEQYEEMRGAIAGIVKDFPEVELVDVVEDAELRAPQVVVETSIGRVEGDLGRSLHDLEAAIRGAAQLVPERVGEHPPEPVLLEAAL